MGAFNKLQAKGLGRLGQVDGLSIQGFQNASICIDRLERVGGRDRRNAGARCLGSRQTAFDQRVSHKWPHPIVNHDQPIFPIQSIQAVYNRVLSPSAAGHKLDVMGKGQLPQNIVSAFLDVFLRNHQNNTVKAVKAIKGHHRAGQ